MQLQKKFTGSSQCIRDLKISLRLFVCWITCSIYFLKCENFIFSGIKFAIDQSFDMITWLSWIAIGVLAVWFHNIGHNISVFYIWILILSLVKKIFFPQRKFRSERRRHGRRHASLIMNLDQVLNPNGSKPSKPQFIRRGSTLSDLWILDS